MRRPRLLRRVEIEARPLAEVVAMIVSHVLSARGGVRRDHDHSMLRGSRIRASLGGEVVLGAGEAREPEKDRKRPGTFGHEHAECHRRARHGAFMPAVAELAFAYPMRPDGVQG